MVGAERGGWCSECHKNCHILDLILDEELGRCPECVKKALEKTNKLYTILIFLVLNFIFFINLAGIIFFAGYFKIPALIIGTPLWAHIFYLVIKKLK